MFNRSACKKQNQRWCAKGGGLWFYYKPIKLQHTLVTRVPLEARKSILQGQFKSVITPTDMRNLHLNESIFVIQFN